ncbi:hypothetical protein ABZ379_01645 [Streptomyces canus]|uniref:hypothetical protein n=1 Tax=Streptomyces canus TaxID=58343 RepID=UPI003406D0F6
MAGKHRARAAPPPLRPAARPDDRQTRGRPGGRHRDAYWTAAADVLAVDLLARPDATTLAVFGTGHQAAYEVRAVSRVRAVGAVLVVGRTAEPDCGGTGRTGP